MSAPWVNEELTPLTWVETNCMWFYLHNSWAHGAKKMWNCFPPLRCRRKEIPKSLLLEMWRDGFDVSAGYLTGLGHCFSALDIVWARVLDGDDFAEISRIRFILWINISEGIDVRGRGDPIQHHHLLGYLKQVMYSIKSLIRLVFYQQIVLLEMPIQVFRILINHDLSNCCSIGFSIQAKIFIHTLGPHHQ